jgi:1-acyl-sn-glycerol-3-phosphate acyltransferase
MLRTFFIILLVVVETGFMSIVAILTSVFDRKGHHIHKVARTWARGILFSSRIHVSVEGISHIDPTQSYIFMPNHLSNFDIPILLAHLPVQFRWLAKKELYKIPIFGFALKRAGYISIDRANLRSAITSLNRAVANIQKGISVTIFPEGTRSLDGNLGPFKKGGFVIAANSGIPVVPIALHGTWEIMSKKGFHIQPGNAVLEILPPIHTASQGKKGRDALMAEVRDMIQRAVDRRKESEIEC